VLLSSQLCLLVDVYDAHDVETYILPMAYHLADDHVAQIRHVTLRLVRFKTVHLPIYMDGCRVGKLICTLSEIDIIESVT